jgi:hypothetical protein
MEKATKRKARKEYSCCSCERTIGKCDHYFEIKGMVLPQEDDNFEKPLFYTHRSCLGCYVTPEQLEEIQKNCKHEKTDYRYTYILGEAVMEPDHAYCIDCGKVI